MVLTIRVFVIFCTNIQFSTQDDFFFLMNQVEMVSGLGFSVYVIPCSQKQFMAG